MVFRFLYKSSDSYGGGQGIPSRLSGIYTTDEMIVISVQSYSVQRISGVYHCGSGIHRGVPDNNVKVLYRLHESSRVSGEGSGTYGRDLGNYGDVQSFIEDFRDLWEEEAEGRCDASIYTVA